MQSNQPLPEIELFLRKMDNKLTILCVSPSCTASELVEAVVKKENVPAYKFNLNYGGRFLGGKFGNGDHLLAEFGISKHHTIEMLGRPFFTYAHEKGELLEAQGLNAEGDVG